MVGNELVSLFPNTFDCIFRACGREKKKILERRPVAIPRRFGKLACEAIRIRRAMKILEDPKARTRVGRNIDQADQVSGPDTLPRRGYVIR